MKLRDSVQMIYSRYVPQANGVSGACGVADAESSLHQQPLAVSVLYEVWFPAGVILTSTLLTD